MNRLFFPRTLCSIHGNRLGLSKRLASTSQINGRRDDPSQSYDIVVNGGGIVGLSFLAALSGSPWFRDKKILLLEQQKQKPKNVLNNNNNRERQLSNRVSSITTASKMFFEELGVCDKISGSVKTATSMHVWSDAFDKGITFTPRFPGLSDLTCSSGVTIRDEAICYFVENHILLQALEEIVPPERIRFGVNATDVVAADDEVDIVLEDKTVIRTNLLVGCDGFNSLVRRKSTLRYFEQPLEESAIVGTVEMDASVNPDVTDNEIAFQRFLPEDGTVIALLPLTKTFSSFVISASKAKAHMMMDLGEEEFVDAMNALLTCDSPVSRGWPKPLKPLIQGMDNALSKVLPSPGPGPTQFPPEVRSLVPKSRASFPLVFGTTIPSLVGSPIGSKNNKIAIIGDSCHRIPPLAGQGLNLGIGDAIQLTECLKEPLERGEDIFASNESLVNCLNSFERQRQFKLLPMMTAVVSMQKLFGLTPSSLVSCFNHFSLFKNEVVKFANTR